MSGAGMAGVTYFASNKDDPYVTLQDPVSLNLTIEITVKIVNIGVYM